MGRVANAVILVYFFNAFLLTIPASFILIWLYRRAVGRAMRAAGSAQGEAPARIDGPGGEPPLTAGGSGGPERTQQFRLAVVYTAAVAMGAAAWSALYFLAPGTEFAALRWFLVWYALLWPVVPVLATLLAVERRRIPRLYGAYVLLGVFGAIVWSSFNRFVLGRTNVAPLGNALNFLLLLAMEAGLPFLVIWIVSNRRIRGVTPLALAALLVFSFCALGVIQSFYMLSDSSWFQANVVSLGWISRRAWFMLASLGVGYVCWLGLRALNARFEHKGFSEVQLLADSYVLIVAFLLSAEAASDFGWKGLWGLAGFAAYRAAAGLGLALWRPSAGPGARLLLLRVFGFQRRTERLFDSIAQRWRFRGGVKMIAGTDLAARTIDPDDTLAFIGGNLGSRFVSGAADLSRRLEQIDEARDPDGRFRVTEFFCHDNTWRPALAALLERSDYVLMDLRGFSESNSGCIFELQQLAKHERLGRTVFVVDGSTNVTLLEATLRSEAAIPALHFERVERGTAAEHERTYRAFDRLAASSV